MTRPAQAAAEHRLALGRTVRALRLARGLTLRDVADLLDVSPATLSAIENGRTGMSSERIARLADELGVPVQRLFVPPPDEAAPARRPQAAPAGEEHAGADGHGGTGRRRAGHPDWRTYAPLDLDAALRGALSSFLEFGYSGATMRTIAERAGLSVPGLYHHYESKQALLVALLDLTMTDLAARTSAARDEGRDPVERFALLVECLALFHTHRRELGFVGASEMRSLEPESRHRVAAMRREQQRMVDAEVEQAVRSGDFETALPREAARAVVTMCTALPQWFSDTGAASAELVAAQYVQFALDVVRCAGPRPGRTPEPP